jgi:hypothetical protein
VDARIKSGHDDELGTDQEFGRLVCFVRLGAKSPRERAVCAIS